MEYQKTFDEELAQILIDYQNQSWIDPETGETLSPVDTSQGSLIFIKAAVLAAAKWGLHRHQSWIAKQIFADLADPEQLEHHCWLRGIYRASGESDESLLSRYLEDLREPAAGGNAADYVRWAKQVTNVAKAWAFACGNGVGTVDVLILADPDITGSEIPSSHEDLSATTTATTAGSLADSGATFVSDGVAIGDVVRNTTTDAETTVSGVTSETVLALKDDIFTSGQNYELVSLVEQVHTYIDGLNPAEMHADDLRVMAPFVVQQNVTMTIPGDVADPDDVAADIEAFMAAMIPGQDLHPTRLAALAISLGEESADVTDPAAPVVTSDYQLIRPGAIDVTIA